MKTATSQSKSSYETFAAARRALHRYTPALRAQHNIVKWWSTQDSGWCYGHQFDARGTATRLITLPKPNGPFDSDDRLANHCGPAGPTQRTPVWVHFDGWAGHRKVRGDLLKKNPKRSLIEFELGNRRLVPNSSITPCEALS